MAANTLRRTVILGKPGENPDMREWPFVAHLRALGRQPEPARRAWEQTPKARGLAAAKQGRLQEAIRLLEHARTETPWRDEEIEANLTELRTIRRLEKKLELRPNDAPTLIAVGKAYFAQERGDAALDCFQRAAKAAPAFAEARAMIGLELHFRGDTAGAESAYREALRLEPSHQLASLYLRDLQNGEPPGGSGQTVSDALVAEAVNGHDVTPEVHPEEHADSHGSAVAAAG
jgi:tetratricopeptide (TPR) repeat protein